MGHESSHLIVAAQAMQRARGAGSAVRGTGPHPPVRFPLRGGRGSGTQARGFSVPLLSGGGGRGEGVLKGEGGGGGYEGGGRGGGYEGGGRGRGV